MLKKIIKKIQQNWKKLEKKEVQAMSMVKTQLLLAPRVEFTFKNLYLKKKKILYTVLACRPQLFIQFAYKSTDLCMQLKITGLRKQ